MLPHTTRLLSQWCMSRVQWGSVKVGSRHVEALKCPFEALMKLPSSSSPPPCPLPLLIESSSLEVQSLRCILQSRCHHHQQSKNGRRLVVHPSISSFTSSPSRPRPISSSSFKLSSVSTRSLTTQSFNSTTKGSATTSTAASTSSSTTNSNNTAGGFTQSNPWGRTTTHPSSPSVGGNKLDMSVTWEQYRRTVSEIVGMFICVTFALATALQSNHRKAVHEEEIEALNYELIESEEEVQRVQRNWNKMMALLRETSQSSSSSHPHSSWSLFGTTNNTNKEVLIPIEALERLAKEMLFVDKSDETISVLKESSLESSNTALESSTTPQDVPTGIEKQQQQQQKSTTRQSRVALPGARPISAVILY